MLSDIFPPRIYIRDIACSTFIWNVIRAYYWLETEMYPVDDSILPNYKVHSYKFAEKDDIFSLQNFIAWKGNVSDKDTRNDCVDWVPLRIRLLDSINPNSMIWLSQEWKKNNSFGDSSNWCTWWFLLLIGICTSYQTNVRIFQILFRTIGRLFVFRNAVDKRCFLSLAVLSWNEKKNALLCFS